MTLQVLERCVQQCAQHPDRPEHFVCLVPGTDPAEPALQAYSLIFLPPGVDYDTWRAQRAAAKVARP